MSKNKEYRLKRKNQRKEYIIQDKNIKIKSLYYANQHKIEKIEKLEKRNKQLNKIVTEFDDKLRIKLERLLNEKDYVINTDDLIELLEILNKGVRK